MIVALRVRFFELESVLCVEPTPVGSTVDCELLQGKSHVLFFASAFNSLANMRPQKKNCWRNMNFLGSSPSLNIILTSLPFKIHSLDFKDFLILDASRNLWIPVGGWVWWSQEHIGDYNHNTRATLCRGGMKNGYSVMHVWRGSERDAEKSSR